MKIFLIFCALFFSSLVFAENISDFQIEGMSVGDSLLNYFNEKEIKKNISGAQYPNKEFILYYFKGLSKFETYEAVTVAVKANDKNYIIYDLGGSIYFKDNFQDCLSMMKKIDSELNQIFTKAQNASGKTFPIEMSISPMQTNDGFIFNAFVHDITDRKMMQTQLSHVQKLESMGELAAGIAHEINNSSSFISGNVQTFSRVWERMLKSIDELLKTQPDTMPDKQLFEFVLDEGILVEYGTHAELLKKKKYYATMVNVQNKNDK